MEFVRINPLVSATMEGVRVKRNGKTVVIVLIYGIWHFFKICLGLRQTRVHDISYN